ncbi:tRNA (adenosine(37)-N6)-threonylcarbamoyltransferase complex dimerization subunit type 1 TsaB [Anatilimnocola floriformis]|uniref:tRNA (adenosine(37)-N6)-threonylcarbamoyltransferase complex dimerization subunit type 1 TsaB n=1 Tax=Anatilimnocola floriformis TaxID=2948575 RepID=UPI0020C255A0|nr:tRNA (adenosine(37)-N6)-threonylcarbamoyltransferase complex dimerization subunit type 1 TsaB [Anatilimnocola floriformis]
MPAWTVAIETVATAGSVALVAPDGSVNELVLPAESRSARTLAAAIQKIWQDAGRPPIELVAVAHGPGSFTGLRVGVITAKALAYAWRAKLIGVNTLDAIAAQIDSLPGQQLHVILEAQRQELFVAKFRALENGHWERTAADEIIAVPQWLTDLQTAEETIVAGPALKKLREKIPLTVSVAEEATWQARAATVGRLGRAQNEAGAADELWTLLPHYLRVSYAEEKKKN